MTNQPGSGKLLLSFDGGGLHCLSQLLILQEVMARLEEDGHRSLPCEYFDLITGVEMGGLVAALLVVCQMSVDKTIAEFMSILEITYASRDLNVDGTAVLREKLEGLLESRGIPIVTQLAESRAAELTCRMFICAVSRANTICRLRNYGTRSQASSKITVIEALLVTCTSFPVRAGGQGYREEIFMNGSFRTNNPTREAILEAYDVFGSGTRIACILSLGASHTGQITLNGPDFTKLLPKIHGEQVANECALQMSDLGLYFRFRVPFGRTTEADIHEVAMFQLTKAHLEDTQVSREVDQCVSKLQRKLGITTLEQLVHSAGGERVLMGPPPVTEHFVKREEPWSAMTKALEPEAEKDHPQKIMVISGMGGSGKTQLTREFARVFKDRYPYICFVDGSSAQSIEADLAMFVASLGCGHARAELRQVLGWFIKTKTERWLIVFDNVGKHLDLRHFIPQCDHGSIIISTRYKTLGCHFPRNYYELGVMSADEAVEALLKAALLPEPSYVARKDAEAIASELGYLPVAIIQAGCFIFKGSCLPEYLGRFKSNRARFLRGSDIYQQSVYTVLQTTLSELSQKAQRFLHLLSYFHFNNIPISMIQFAAKHSFSFEVDSYLDRSIKSSKATEHLIHIFDGADGEEIEQVIGVLRDYSLVEIDRTPEQRLIRLHPMVQAWAQDELKFEDPQAYRDAAVRLLSSCAGKENKPIHRFIVPHIHRLYPCGVSTDHTNVEQLPLHPNDKAAFAELLWQTSPKAAVKLWEETYQSVQNATEINEWYRARLLLKLGKGYHYAGPLSQAEVVNKQALDILQRIRGPRDRETIKAQAHLAYAYFCLGQYDDAERLQTEVLDLRKETQGEEHLDTIDAAAKLALTLNSRGRPLEALPIQQDVLRRRTDLLGKEHTDTMVSMSNLARTYTNLRLHDDAEHWRLQVLELRRKVLGEDHIDTIISSENLAVTYCSQGRYREAMVLQEAVLKDYKRIFEPGYIQTALGTSYLASIYYHLDMLHEAEQLASEARKVQSGVLSLEHEHYKQTVELLRQIQSRKAIKSKHDEDPAPGSENSEGYAGRTRDAGPEDKTQGAEAAAGDLDEPTTDQVIKVGWGESSSERMSTQPLNAKTTPEPTPQDDSDPEEVSSADESGDSESPSDDDGKAGQIVHFDGFKNPPAIASVLVQQDAAPSTKLLDSGVAMSESEARDIKSTMKQGKTEPSLLPTNHCGVKRPHPDEPDEGPRKRVKLE